jgi:hypothetical protein
MTRSPVSHVATASLDCPAGTLTTAEFLSVRVPSFGAVTAPSASEGFGNVPVKAPPAASPSFT